MTKYDLPQLCRLVQHLKSTNGIQHITTKKENMIISENAEKVFDKIKHSFPIRTQSKL